MARPTATFKTSSGKEVEHYTYLNAAEFNELQKIFLTVGKVNLVGGKDAEITDIDPTYDMRAKEKAIELLVVKFDGSDQDCAKRIMTEIPHDEAAEIDAALEAVTSPKKKTNA